MATIREWLTEAGFDFNAGTIVYQEIGKEECRRWASPIAASIMPPEILDKEFYDGYDCDPNCPRFFARCGDWIYFPGQYDGSTWLEIVNINFEHYLNHENKTPYPGGS